MKRSQPSLHETRDKRLLGKDPKGAGVAVTPAPVHFPTQWPLVPSFPSVVDWARTFHLTVVNILATCYGTNLPVVHGAMGCGQKALS